MYGLRNLHHTDRICIQTYTRHCWLTRGGLASVILISSAFFLLVNIGRRTLFIFLPRSESCLRTSSADLWSLNKPSGCICLTNTNLLLILWHTHRHLFQRIDEHEHTAIGKHLWSISYSAVPLVLELVSLVEGGQGVGLNRDVAIFVFFAHFFLFSFRFFVHIFPFGLFSFILTHDRLAASRDFCDNAFLVYVVTGLVARSTGSLFR